MKAQQYKRQINEMRGIRKNWENVVYSVSHSAFFGDYTSMTYEGEWGKMCQLHNLWNVHNFPYSVNVNQKMNNRPFTMKMYNIMQKCKCDPQSTQINQHHQNIKKQDHTKNLKISWSRCNPLLTLSWLLFGGERRLSHRHINCLPLSVWGKIHVNCLLLMLGSPEERKI